MGGDADRPGAFGTELTFNGLLVYDVSASSGFSLRGRVAHQNTPAKGERPNAHGFYDSGSHSRWWTDASSQVKRSIVMDDYVFSVTERRIEVNDLRGLAKDVAELRIY